MLEEIGGVRPIPARIRGVIYFEFSLRPGAKLGEVAGPAKTELDLPLIYLAVLKTIFDFDLGPPPRGVPGEGPDCQFPQEIGGLGAIPARIRGIIHFVYPFCP